MTQHSAQHLISAVALNTFQLDTHSFSLSQSSLTSFIDFCFDEKKVSVEEQYSNLKAVETLVNDRIRQNLSMAPKWLDPQNNAEDAQFFQTNVRSRLLPDAITGPIRLVQIGGTDQDHGIAAVDCNTCCGTHVPTLGTLQMIKFFKLEKVKKWDCTGPLCCGSTIGPNNGTRSLPQLANYEPAQLSRSRTHLPSHGSAGGETCQGG